MVITLLGLNAVLGNPQGGARRPTAALPALPGAAVTPTVRALAAGAAGRGVVPLEAYLFWGAEYWLLRSSAGDDSYLRAFERILEES
ncbi:MAG TPA: hypothetical protein VMW80_10150 [Candidatus Dormibacteraeota bacterium]|nr:hypothetical protein [Candidatus Dormibacteraeota bacterium]